LNTFELARQAYAPSRPQVSTPVEVEAAIFGQITSRLRAAIRDKGPSGRNLAAAIDENRRLWTLLCVDLANDDNGLPRDLRAQLFGLGEFVQRHSSKVLRKEAVADVLVEINTAVLNGLNADRRAS